MRAVAQRVSRAEVRVRGEVVGRIGPGLCVLVGVTHQDTARDATWLAEKLYGLRVLDGERSCAQAGAALLVVSQFTLYGDVRRGHRPSWGAAAPAARAQPLVEQLVAELRARGASVATGSFGAEMELELTNDGPMTIVLDSPPAR